MTDVLMFGWEFPPFKSGGLGTACRDLCKGLNRLDVNVTFVMPVSPDQVSDTGFADMIGAKQNLTGETVSMSSTTETRGVISPLQPYRTPSEYVEHLVETSTEQVETEPGDPPASVYGDDLLEEVDRYSHVAGRIAEEESFDVIHAHDWMTYRAGIVAREISGKPLVVHIHATEFDRTAGNPTHAIADREYQGLREADLVIANSDWTRSNVLEAYDVEEEKIEVVHWGIEFDDETADTSDASRLNDEYNLVLFLGRITVQKGPDYFIDAAAEVLEHEPETRFVMAGDGDMLPSVIEQAADLGIRDNVIFTGWLEDDEVNRIFQTADLFVMPSVSEPFGLVALESLKNGTPAILSKQSGVSEVLDHCMKVDFWDVDEMANKIVGALRYPSIRKDMSSAGSVEVDELGLEEPARGVLQCYRKAISNRGDE